MKSWFITLLFLLAGSQLMAAANSGSLRGRLTTDGVAIAAASVSASCRASATTMETLTEADGSYWLPVLEPGPCELTFVKSGYQSLTRSVDVHAGEETRADASLELSADGESVTSTDTMRSVLERAEVTWAPSRETLELLPSRRSVNALLMLGPGGAFAAPGIDSPESTRIEGIERTAEFGAVDAIGPVSVILGGAASGEPSYRDRLALVSTRPADSWDASARLTSEREHGVTKSALELTGGGVPHERLQLFGAFRGGRLRDVGGNQWLATADAAPAVTNSVRATIIGDDGETQWSVRDAWVASSRLTFDASASDGAAQVAGLRAAYFLTSGAGTHELRAGLDRRKLSATTTAFHLDDHWTASDFWSVDGGVRVERDRILPRLGVVVDPRRNGNSRIAANYGRYGAGADAVQETTLAYGRQFDNGTWVTAMLLRRRGEGDRDLTGVAIDASYQYLIFSFGGNATFARRAGSRVTSGNVWVIADAPLLEHDVNLALLERVRDDFFATDLAISYSWSGLAFRPSAKLEFENLFGRTPVDSIHDARPRAIRIGVGVSRR